MLLIAFGGPQGRADIRPFLANVLRGRRVSPERVDEVAHHYEIFDGVSPITELTLRQARGLREALVAAGIDLPVYVGMRNWHPYLRDTLAQMAQNGVRRAVCIIAAAHRSYSSCTQYRENVAEARHSLPVAGLPDIEITYVDDWYLSPGFIEANAERVLAALGSLPMSVRADAQLVFTAHSIPASMAQRYPYERQLEETCAAVAAHVARARSNATASTPHVAPSTLHVARSTPQVAPSTSHVARSTSDVARSTSNVAHRTSNVAAWRLVFQSRSGRPDDPWLEPDVCDYLRDAAAAGVRAVVLCPIGFVCDHIEVLYDLDIEAMDVAKQLGLPLARAAAVNDDPRFLEALAGAVADTVQRYANGRALPLVAVTA